MDLAERGDGALIHAADPPDHGGVRDAAGVSVWDVSVSDLDRRGEHDHPDRGLCAGTL